MAGLPGNLKNDCLTVIFFCPLKHEDSMEKEKPSTQRFRTSCPTWSTCCSHRTGQSTHWTGANRNSLPKSHSFLLPGLHLPRNSLPSRRLPPLPSSLLLLLLTRASPVPGLSLAPALGSPSPSGSRVREYLPARASESNATLPLQARYLSIPPRDLTLLPYLPYSSPYHLPAPRPVPAQPAVLRLGAITLPAPHGLWRLSGSAGPRLPSAHTRPIAARPSGLRCC